MGLFYPLFITLSRRACDKRDQKQVPRQVRPERPDTGRPQQRGDRSRHLSGVPHRPVAFKGRGRPGAVLAVSSRPDIHTHIPIRRNGRCGGGSSCGDAEARDNCCWGASRLEQQEGLRVSSSRAQVW